MLITLAVSKKTELSTLLTVGSKIIQALEIIRVKKLTPKTILLNKYLPSHDV